MAAAAAGLGYIATVQSLAMALQMRSPADAYALAPRNEYIAAQLASQLSGPNATANERERAARLGRFALLKDPTSIDAVVTLGLDAEINHNSTSARRLFQYAEALSRRNLQAQMWAIGDDIRRDDVPAVLSHYDIALRTSERASTLLFPVLASAIADPTIRTSLAKTLSRNPPWSDAFINYVVVNGTSPAATASLFKTLLQRGVTIPDAYSSGLIKALISADQPDQAWAYYTVTHSNANVRLSRDPSFRSNSETPSPFDWVPISGGGISASLRPSHHESGALTFSAPPSVGGPVVAQTELLPAGRYELHGRSKGIAQPNDSRPYWSLICRDGRELGRADVPNSAVAGGRFSGQFTVPADCPLQVLKLNLRPSSNISGVAGQITRARLQPAR